jgi:4-hydroxybenzoate polyprenyltransferase
MTPHAAPLTRWRTKLRLFLALSRTPHGLLDMAAPCLAALLGLGAFPPLGITVLGLVTVFAGYTAVYALNDLVGFRSDRAKLAAAPAPLPGPRDLDALTVRHPLAQGLLGFPEALAWALGWGAVALAGAWHLNPVCLLIFVGGCLLEAVYCLLWRVSPYRSLVSGAVKTAGSLAAVFAVDPQPSAVYLLMLFLTFFCWEIGGQNVPNDWTDLEEDRRFGARTIPVVFGLARSRDIILGALFLAVALSLGLWLSAPGPAPPLPLAAVAAAGAGLLLLPAWRLTPASPRPALMALFNRASWYPPALLAVALGQILLF